MIKGGSLAISLGSIYFALNTLSFSLLLTHSYLETCTRIIDNSAEPDQMPHYVASDQGLQCLLTKVSIKNRIKMTK